MAHAIMTTQPMIVHDTQTLSTSINTKFAIFRLWAIKQGIKVSKTPMVQSHISIERLRVGLTFLRGLKPSGL
jgi:hypothetical protein